MYTFWVLFAGVRKETAQLVKCFETPTERSWSQLPPAGYLYNNTWHIRYCRGPTVVSEYRDCLNNKSLVFVGDSNALRSYETFPKKYECNDPPGQASGTIRNMLRCSSKTWQFTASYNPVSMPFSAYGWAPNKPLRSIPVILSDIPDDASDTVAIISMYVHYLFYSPSVYRTRIRKIRKTIEHTLKRNSKITFVIKGPHSFMFGNQPRM
jgi:hypothetical protein